MNRDHNLDMGELMSSMRSSRPPEESAAKNGDLSPSQLRAGGDRARDDRNWAGAAAFYTALFQHEPSSSLSLQIGHMLKELGLLEEARGRYLEAGLGSPNDPEPKLQLALLSKLQNKFHLCEPLLRQAREAGYRDEVFIQKELLFLGHVANHTDRFGKGSDPLVVLSSVSKAIASNEPQSLKSFLGGTHYSYNILMATYAKIMSSIGIDCLHLRNPEFLTDVRELTRRPLIHLGFYPPEAPRFLKGAYNVICLAWEFERLRTPGEISSYHAFSNPAQMLANADEIWATSDYGRAALAASGLEQARAVPAPVLWTGRTKNGPRPSLQDAISLAESLDRVRWTPLAICPQMQPMLSQGAERATRRMLDTFLDYVEVQDPIIFVSIFNVHDFRKQIKPLVEAFVRLAATRRDVMLLLKMTCLDSHAQDTNAMLLMEQILEEGEMTPPLISDRILITTDALTEEEMNALYEMSSFYVCSSHAEGQNLPLIEAMIRGVVPVSVTNTAMGEFICDDNAVVISSEQKPFTPRLSRRYGMYNIDVSHTSGPRVYNALEEAAHQSESEYERKSAAATATARQKFSADHLIGHLQRVCRQADAVTGD